MDHWLNVFAQGTGQTGSQTGSQTGTTFQLAVSDWITLFLLVALFLILLTPMLLRGFDRDFFKIPYITWFLLQYGIAALVVVAVLILALTKNITAEGVTGVFGSLIGYVLGSTSRRQDGADQAARHITGVTPNTGAANTPVTITGIGFGSAPGTVRFGNVAATVTSWTDSAIHTTVPAGLPQGPVDITLRPANANYQLVSPPNSFTAA